MKSAFFRLFSLVVVGCLLVGCSGSQADPGDGIPSLWRSRFEEALKDPELSPFEKEALSDYSVSDAEYREAQSLYQQCMTDLGWIVEIQDNQYDTTGGPLIGNDWTAEELNKDSDNSGVSKSIPNACHV